MKKPLLLLLFCALLFGSGSLVFAAPVSNILRNILPETTNTYDLGTSTAQWKNVYSQTVCINGDCQSTWPSGTGSGFSTTSSNFWASAGLGFSTTSATYWGNIQGYVTSSFSTTSANVWSAAGLGFSTTSANVWGALKGYLTSAVTSVTATAPLLSSGGNTPNITWTGLVTTTQPASSNLLVSNGAAGIYGVATGTVSCTGSASCSTFTVLGSGGTINVSAGTAASSTLLTDGNTFSGINKFTNASSDFSGTLSGYTIASILAQSFSTTSANSWAALGLGFSTTSSDYWRSQRTFSSTTLSDSNTFSGVNTFSQMLLLSAGLLSVGSSTLNGNATTTGTHYASIASSSRLYGSGLFNCSSGNFLTWVNGVFGCATDQTGSGGGTYPFTPTSNFGQITSATSAPLWMQSGFFASSTAVLSSTTFALNGKVGVGTSSPYAELAVITNENSAENSPAFIVATTSTISASQYPLLTVLATTTGAQDYARVGIGTTSPWGSAGLRDQLTVSGRIYSTWRYLGCDSLGSGFPTNVTITTDTAVAQYPGLCGTFAYDFNGGNALTQNDVPNTIRLSASNAIPTTNTNGVIVRTGGQITNAGQNPVLEAWVMASTTPSATSTPMYQVGFSSISYPVSNPNTLPTDAAYFIASTSQNWKAVTRRGGVETMIDTGISTSTNPDGAAATTSIAILQKMRVELSSTSATFLINGNVVAVSTTNIPQRNLTPVLLVSVFTPATGAFLQYQPRMLASLLRVWIDDPAGGGVPEPNRTVVVGASREFAPWIALFVLLCGFVFQQVQLFKIKRHPYAPQM